MPPGEPENVVILSIDTLRPDHLGLYGYPRPTSPYLDELGREVTLDSIANSRSTVGMNGSGYIEMLARQMTAELQTRRDGLGAGGSASLGAKGIPFFFVRVDQAGTITKRHSATRACSNSSLFQFSFDFPRSCPRASLA